jgi:hypothetical protein
MDTGWLFPPIISLCKKTDAMIGEILVTIKLNRKKDPWRKNSTEQEMIQKKRLD